MIATAVREPVATRTVSRPAGSWRAGLPVLSNGTVTLRELRQSDAQTLVETLNAETVSRFISPPPTSAAGLERFIEWSIRERAAGRLVCYAIVLEECQTAVGLVQIRALGPAFDVAEWGFALEPAHWGSGVFVAAAREVIAFAFEVLGTHRLEARAAVENGRGNGALQKLGAMREGVLRKSFLRRGEYHDQVIWSICADEWEPSDLR